MSLPNIGFGSKTDHDQIGGTTYPRYMVMYAERKETSDSTPNDEDPAFGFRGATTHTTGTDAKVYMGILNGVLPTPEHNITVSNLSAGIVGETDRVTVKPGIVLNPTTTATAPDTKGSLMYDSGTDELKYWDGSWQVVSAGGLSAHVLDSETYHTATGLTVGWVISADSATTFSWKAPAGGTDDDAIHDNVANEITAITPKTTLGSTDEFVLEDGGASFVKKAVTFANIESSISLANLGTRTHASLSDAPTSAHHVRYADSEVEDVITAEIVNGQSIDNAIDTLISTHAGDVDAHHDLVTGVGPIWITMASQEIKLDWWVNDFRLLDVAGRDYLRIGTDVPSTDEILSFNGTNVVWIAPSIASHDMTGASHTEDATGGAGNVLRASGATTFAWATLAHGDLSDAPSSAHHVRYADSEVESVIDAEIVGGQSIDNAIDGLISTHASDNDAHHDLATGTDPIYIDSPAQDLKLAWWLADFHLHDYLGRDYLRVGTDTPSTDEVLTFNGTNCVWDTPAVGAHVLATTGPHTDTLPWTDLNKSGSSLADLATRAHSNLSDAPTDAHHDEAHVLATTGPHSGTLPWTDLNKSGSSLADLATRAHSNLSDAPTSAHHVRYADSEVRTVITAECEEEQIINDAIDGLIYTHAGLATVHQNAPALISTHAGLASIHHTAYTDTMTESVINAELADGQSINNAIDSLIIAHTTDDAHHDPVTVNATPLTLIGQAISFHYDSHHFKLAADPPDLQMGTDSPNTDEVITWNGTDAVWSPPSPGSGTQWKLPVWATTSTLGDSMLTQNSGGTILSAIIPVGNAASFIMTSSEDAVLTVRGDRDNDDENKHAWISLEQDGTARWMRVGVGEAQDDNHGFMASYEQIDVFIGTTFPAGTKVGSWLSTGLSVLGAITVTGNVDGVDVSAHAIDIDAHHDLVTVSALPLTLSGQAVTFNYNTNHFKLTGNNLEIGTDTPSTDEALTWNGSAAVWAVPSGSAPSNSQLCNANDTGRVMEFLPTVQESTVYTSGTISYGAIFLTYRGTRFLISTGNICRWSWVLSAPPGATKIVAIECLMRGTSTANHKIHWEDMDTARNSNYTPSWNVMNTTKTYSDSYMRVVPLWTGTINLPSNDEGIRIFYETHGTSGNNGTVGGLLVYYDA